MKSTIEGVWYNQHGSKLDLKASGTHELTGCFSSASGLAAKSDEPSPVRGFIAGDLVAFVCDFGKFGSLTTWTGHVVTEGEEPVIETQWQMAVALPSPHGSEELWRGLWTGWDAFHRTPPELKKAPARIPSHPLPEWP